MNVIEMALQGNIGGMSPAQRIELRTAIQSLQSKLTTLEAENERLEKEASWQEDRAIKAEQANTKLQEQVKVYRTIFGQVHATLVCHGHIDANTDLHHRIEQALNQDTEKEQKLTASQYGLVGRKEYPGE